MILTFGNRADEQVKVDVLCYERQPNGDYWLAVKVRVRTGRFRNTVFTRITTEALCKFLSELRAFYATLKGVVEFKDNEHQFSLRLISDKTGHIKLNGEVVEGGSHSDRLNFVLHFDQTYLAKSIRRLEEIASQLPLLEKRNREV
jgi:hypothetical protein